MRKCIISWTFLLCLSCVSSFNLDVNAPIYRFGPKGTNFGYSVAEHFKGEKPVMLIGAPRGESGQTGTERAGAMYSCDINTFYNSGSQHWCEQVRFEYDNSDDYAKRPNETRGRTVHPLGKNDQLLASTIVSKGTKNGSALVCAPLIRYHQTAAYPQGACYELESNLRLQNTYATCAQKNLPTTDRHNEYGGCMEGFSAAITQDTVVTGLIGSVKWTGGVFAKKSSASIFDSVVEKYTMNQPAEDSIRTRLVAHDYLGYSVDIGRFGFWYEDGKPITVVSGATRYGEHGAVIFLPFIQDSSSKLTLNEDKYIINGTAMGSAFGYSIEVVDLNGDGFDDLIVGAPFEHRTGIDGNFGGIVYVYFSQGIQRQKHESHLVFHPPKVIKSPDFYSQFGLSITKLGNVDGDKNGLNDFAVGAPFAFDGAGAVYIYLGTKNIDKFRKKPAQVIKGNELPNLPEGMRSFGFSLSGGSDMDENGYPDLLVGSPSKNFVALLRARPVISIDAKHKMQTRMIDIDKGVNCPRGAKTCFPLEMVIYVDEESTRGAELVDFSSDVFMCNLEAIPYRADITARGFIEGSHSHNFTWPCGSNSHMQKRTYRQNIYLPIQEAKDWITPLKFRFTVSIRNEKKPIQPPQGSQVVDLKHFPVLNKYGASYEFDVPFNTLCGEDHTCQTDLSLKATFKDIPLTPNGYVSNVGEKDYLDITFTVENKKEKAYQANFYLEYNEEELELPQVHGTKRMIAETIGKNIVHLPLGNPMNGGSKHHFTIQFKLTRGRTEGIGKALKFLAHVNSTSQETEDELKDNKWEAEVQIIKKAELEIYGISTPDRVFFGGKAKAESELELEEDIGTMVRHNYTITNHGPWTVRKCDCKIRLALSSSFEIWKRKMGIVSFGCSNNHNRIHRWNKRTDIKLNTKYSTQETTPNRVEHRYKRSVEDEENGNSDDLETSREIENGGEEEQKGFLYSLAKMFNLDLFSGGEGIQRVVQTLSCQEKTANCFTVVCHFDFLDANSAVVVDFRARLWNSTFIEDYSGAESVKVISVGRLELDASQGIDDNPHNNQATITTSADPDRPTIGDSRPIPWWIIVVAVVIGILILLLLSFCLYKCGFFKRKRLDQPSLYTAQLRHEREQWADTGL
ncbi:CBN-INA-1 protein [Caenorhabditis brenneri]|uniref:CBN-INA-1 protein n=1 Tax=Caenorhabditis brenneri TaxID=135651 RepID=G0MJW7_CAEBE|nr:CBN-INA-1 protein [Caenorhabditis brenneri]